MIGMLSVCDLIFAVAWQTMRPTILWSPSIGKLSRAVSLIASHGNFFAMLTERMSLR